jgi:chemotaxis protein methyltransferase CheR
MYFTPPAAREVIANIARSLAPGGVLFLGHAENLRGLSHDFHLRHSHATFYYERRSGPASSVEPISLERTPAAEPTLRLSDDTSWFEAIARSSSRIERLSRDVERGATPANGVAARAVRPESNTTGPASDDLASAMDLMKRERFLEALRLLSTAGATADREPDALLLRAMLLVSTGELAQAETACEQLLDVDDLSAGAHYIMAIVREHANDRAGAIEHSRAAAYLDPDFAMPHLQLGRLARRTGDIATARRELGLALALLSREDAARIILFGGGFGRDALVALCRGELNACGSDQ